ARRHQRGGARNRRRQRGAGRQLRAPRLRSVAYAPCRPHRAHGRRRTCAHVRHSGRRAGLGQAQPAGRSPDPRAQRQALPRRRELAVPGAQTRSYPDRVRIQVRAAEPKPFPAPSGRQSRWQMKRADALLAVKTPTDARVALLVDDELASRTTQQTRLESQGYTVFVAVNQADALSRAKLALPAVIFVHLVTGATV